MTVKDKVDPADFVSHADAEDIEEDLGSNPSQEELDRLDDDEDAEKPEKPAKKPAAKTDEEEEEEEEEEDPPEKTELEKTRKQLGRTAAARQRLEAQVEQQRAELERLTAERSETGKKKLEQLTERLDNLYEQVEEARARGETSTAAKLQREIDGIRDDATRSQSAYLAAREAVKTTELRAYNTMAQELEYLDPRFNPDSDEFDQALLDDVNEMVDAFEAKGVPLTDALRKACKVVLREDVFATKRALRRDEKPAARGPIKTDVAKNLKDAKKQPPEEPGITRDRTDAEIDMATISEKDFDALPQAVLDRLLGNTP